MGSLHNNIQLILKLLKSLFLTLHFSYYILMAFLMILSMISISVLIILLYILSVIKHLICGNNLNWLLNLNLRDNVDRGRNDLLILMLEKKLDWFRLTSLINNTGAIDGKMDGSALEEKSSFKMLGLTYLLNWIVALTLTLLLKLHPRKFEP